MLMGRMARQPVCLEQGKEGRMASKEMRGIKDSKISKPLKCLSVGKPGKASRLAKGNIKDMPHKSDSHYHRDAHGSTHTCSFAS